MNSFSIIISKLLECLYDDEYKIKTNNPVTSFVCGSFINDNKFTAFDKNILNPYFITGSIKERHINCFFKAQKIYHILCRFVTRYKISKAIQFDSTTDLCLNDISTISELSILKLYVDSTRVLYTFRISDLIQVINSALTYNSGFFAEPQIIKNPYTNIPFTKSELYNIYYSIKYSHFEMPYLYQQYLKHDFSLIKFTYLNEPMLREIAIDDFCKSSTVRQKYNQIIKMLVDNDNIFNTSNIDPDFPKVKLTEAFSYLLKDYLTLSFSLISVLRKTSKHKIRRELAEFKALNPLYGRKILVRQYNLNSDIPFVFGDKTRPYTIEHKFIDTVVKRTPVRLKRKRATTSLNSTRENRVSRGRTNTDAAIRRRGAQGMSNTELDRLFSWPLVTENVFIEEGNEDTSYNSHNAYTTIDSTNDANDDDDDDDSDDDDSDDDDSDDDDSDDDHTIDLLSFRDDYSSDESSNLS